jgi:nitrite reductase (cytochrome c-552)
MSETTPPSPAPRARKTGYLVAMIVTAAATVLVLWLLQSIWTRQQEAQQVVFRVVELDESSVDPALWGRNFPRQYDSYRGGIDAVRTRHGGSEAFQKLDEAPRWRTIFAGYPFSVDYREERGHAFMLTDQEETQRVQLFNQPGACLHCHCAVLPAYRDAGRKAGIADTDDFNWPQVQRGFEIVCAMPYWDARPMVEHPVSCQDCHDPHSMRLRITRPAFLAGIRALAQSGTPVPHLPSIERWRASSSSQPYDPNTAANRQEMRTLVCAQCHVEYYFRGPQKLLTYPWSQGLRAEQIEAYYDAEEFSDWKHALTGAGVLKAQHPEFELWSQGVHARAGVACADCHMPYRREGAIKVSDHQVRSPLLDVATSCRVCHGGTEEQLRGLAESIQDRTRGLMDRAEVAVVELIEALQAVQAGGGDETRLQAARQRQRQAQWRLDFVAAENSMGFHASQESARLLAEAIDLARRGQIELLRLLRDAPEDSATGPAGADSPLGE